MNKPLPDVDLSSAFAKPSRAAGIKLPPAKKTAKTAQSAAQRPMSAVPDPEAAPTPEAAQIAPEAPEAELEATRTEAKSRTPGTKATKKVASSRSTAAAKAPATATRPSAGQGRLVLWTPVAIRARMQAVQAASGTLYLDQVLDALEATVDRLPDLVTEATSAPHVQGPLFERTVAASAETGSPQRVQLTIRGVLNSQLAVIDQLVETSGAPSRSALINAALDATLPA